MTETLTIAADTLSPWDRTIDENCVSYQTAPVYLEYEVYECERLTVDDDTVYGIEGWMGEKYVAINGRADKLTELLVEFESGYEKKTLATGEEWGMGGGFTLEPKQIDLEGGKVWFYLSKDGSELDNKVISAPDVYTYTVDIGGEYDVPVFSCYVDAVFRGTDTNLVQVKYVFLIDDDVLDIDCGDEYGVMEVVTATASQVIIENCNTLVLDLDSTVEIMGDLYFKTADEATAIRFYPFVEYTDPGMYEIRGAVQNFVDVQSTDITWNAYNFGAFWYDLDDDLSTETLTIAANILDAPWDRTIDANNLVYNTTSTDVDFDYSGWGEYNMIGFMAEKYFAGYDGTETDEEITDDDISLVSNNMLSKVLIDDDNDHAISTGASLELQEDYELKPIQLDVSGERAQLELLHDGKSVDTDIINAPDTYVYTKDIGTLEDVPIIAIHISSVYVGTETDTVTMDGIFQISEDYISVEPGDKFGAMEVTTICSGAVILENEYPIELYEDSEEHVMGNLYFKTADNTSTIRFYPFVERTIGGVPSGGGGGGGTYPPGWGCTINDTDGDGVPDVWDVDNSTPIGYWVNPQGIGRRWGDMNGDGELTSVDALMILQAAAGKIGL
jgi:S-layer protein (TIGR01567 family)